MKYDELTADALAEIKGKNLHYQHHLAGDYHLHITGAEYNGKGIVEVHLRFVTGEASVPIFDAIEQAILNNKNN